MVEIIEVKAWTHLRVVYLVEVKSLEDLKKIAEGFNIPFIFQRGKEYVFFYGHLLHAPICLRFKG